MTDYDISQNHYVPPAPTKKSSQDSLSRKKQPRFTSIRGTPAPLIPRPKEPVQKDEDGVPIVWKMQRLKEAAKDTDGITKMKTESEVPAVWSPGRLRRARNNSDFDDSSSVSTTGTAAAESAAADDTIMNMWRASLKQTSRYKYMDVDDLKKYIDEERERTHEENAASVVNEFIEKHKNLRSTPARKRSDSIFSGSGSGDGSVILDMTADSGARSGSYYDGEVAVNDGWLAAQLKQQKPTSQLSSLRWQNKSLEKKQLKMKKDTNNTDDKSKKEGENCDEDEVEEDDDDMRAR